MTEIPDRHELECVAEGGAGWSGREVRYARALLELLDGDTFYGFLDRAIRCSEDAVDAWGEIPEERMVYEEVGELLVALTHYQRGKTSAEDVIDEAADLVLVGTHAASLVGASETELADAIEAKLQRTENRIQEGSA